MTVKNLLVQLNNLLNEELLKEDDELIIVGSGDRETGYLADTLLMPRVIVEIESHNTGYYFLGIKK